jgi:Na+/proline symporter
MSLTTFALKKYMSEVQDSEMYLTAKRSVRSGLIASSVVSSWTLSATLLSTTNFGYLYGIAATFWFGAGCSVPILTFAVLAIELKRKAPNAHTFLELVKHRYGAPGHIVLAIYSLIYQIFISVNLLVGGAAVFHLTTGMHQVAVCFLFPLGVCVYTFFGGIKATFLTEWGAYIPFLQTLFTS